MDPFIEAQDMWEDLHNKLMGDMAPAGSQVSFIDALGQEQTSSYDDANRLVQVDNREGKGGKRVRLDFLGGEEKGVRLDFALRVLWSHPSQQGGTLPELSTEAAKSSDLLALWAKDLVSSIYDDNISGSSDHLRFLPSGQRPICFLEEMSKGSTASRPWCANVSSRLPSGEHSNSLFFSRTQVVLALVSTTFDDNGLSLRDIFLARRQVPGLFEHAFRVAERTRSTLRRVAMGIGDELGAVRGEVFGILPAD
jgi:hypothetical protein